MFFGRWSRSCRESSGSDLHRLNGTGEEILSGFISSRSALCEYEWHLGMPCAHFSALEESSTPPVVHAFSCRINISVIACMAIIGVRS